MAYLPNAKEWEAKLLGYEPSNALPNLFCGPSESGSKTLDPTLETTELDEKQLPDRFIIFFYAIIRIN